jgi:peptide/nickel transport system ATP-binding protein
MRLLPEQSRVTGEILYQGKSILGLSEPDLQHLRGEMVSLVFQDPMTRLDPLMTIGEHCLRTIKSHFKDISHLEATKRTKAVLEKVKIPSARHQQYPHEFSGGMRQRVVIALALLLNPRLIIADEPTTALDVTVAAEILDELTRLVVEEQIGLVLVSHDLALVGKYCHKLAVMYQGKIVEMGDSQSILVSPQHPYTQSLLEAALHLNQPRPFFRIGSWEQPILEVRNLKQHYKLEGSWFKRWNSEQNELIRAVDGVNFSVWQGEILGLVGESGCGKSTLSRTILQLIPPTGGQVKFKGQELTLLSSEQMRRLRREITMVYQDPHACLNPLMTIAESIADPLLIHNMATRNQSQQRVQEMLERVGLTPVETYQNRYPRQLSGGQKQRVAIARALITNPSLVICDEPVSMLDAPIQRQILELILSLKDEFNLTYIFITHDLAVAKFLCNRVAVMQSGQIVEIGETEQIFSHPQHPYTRKLLNSAPLIVK